MRSAFRKSLRETMRENRLIHRMITASEQPKPGTERAVMYLVAGYRQEKGGVRVWEIR